MGQAPPTQTDAPAPTNKPDTARALSRDLGLLDIVLFGVGGIVGAGIYAIIGEAAAFGGNLLWVSFLGAAVVALLTAATYAELVSRYPDAGGSFEYVKQAFGLKVATGASVFMLFTGVVAAGAIAISFSDYMARLVGLPTVLTTLGIIAAMGVLNGLGAAQASWFNTVATVVTLLGLGAVVVASAGDIGSVDLLSFEDATLVGLGTGSALIFFSFIGFEDLVKLAEETKQPERTMPRGLLLSAGIVLVVYLLVAVAAVSALGADELAQSSGPLAEILDVKLGAAWATGIVAIALFATSKTILSNILGTSRLLFDVSRDNEIRWLDALARVHSATRTPVRAIAVVAAIAMAFGAIGNLRIVAAVSNILILLVFLLVNIALLRIRWSRSDDAPFRIPVSVGPYPLSALLAIAGVAALLLLNVRAIVTGAA
ncbi:MAG: amino acid permease [Acidimicrobiia bacterium]|nr:amino acid permease [Acidimicrobiia bacterium]